MKTKQATHIDNTRWIQVDHVADSSKRTLLLSIVSDVSEAEARRPNERHQMRCNLFSAVRSQSANRDRWKQHLLAHMYQAKLDSTRINTQFRIP